MPKFKIELDDLCTNCLKAVATRAFEEAREGNLPRKLDRIASNGDLICTYCGSQDYMTTYGLCRACTGKLIRQEQGREATLAAERGEGKT